MKQIIFFAVFAFGCKAQATWFTAIKDSTKSAKSAVSAWFAATKAKHSAAKAVSAWWSGDTKSAKAAESATESAEKAAAVAADAVIRASFLPASDDYSAFASSISTFPARLAAFKSEIKATSTATISGPGWTATITSDAE